MSSVIIVIPAYNEEKTIKKVLESLSKYEVDVVVVDDGSIDNTGTISSNMGAFVITNKTNIGYDKSIEKGLFFGLEGGYCHAITMDADGQHPAEDVIRFIEAFNNGFGLVIGIRGRLQRLTEHLFSFVAKKIWGIADPLCGMKGYKLSFLEKVGFFDSYKSMGTEFAIRLTKIGIKNKQIRLSRVIDRLDKPRLGSTLRSNMFIFKDQKVSKTYFYRT